MKQIALMTFLFLFSIPVHAETITIDVTIKEVDAEDRAMTVTTKAKELKLEVAKRAEIVIDGEIATLGEVTSGQSATITYESMLEIVTKIAIGETSIEELKPLQGTWLVTAEEGGGKADQEVRSQREEKDSQGGRGSLFTFHGRL